MEQNEQQIEFNNQPQRVAPQPQMPMQEQQIVAQSGEQIKYAGFWIRWVAYLVDSLIVGIPIFILGVVLGFIFYDKSAAFENAGVNILRLLLIVLTWSYFIIMTKKYGATLGKMAFGLEVRSDKSESLSWGQVILRETLGKIISYIILYIGFIMAGFASRKQALHDKIASTVVVYKDPNKKFGAGAIILIIIACIIPVVAILGIFASIVLVSLSSARYKAQDAAVKASISSVIPLAIEYQDEKGTLQGFKPEFSILKTCNGNPIVNISKDGKEMAILVKLCSEDKKYACGDFNSNISEVDETYAKSMATSCPKNNSNLQLPPITELR